MTRERVPPPPGMVKPPPPPAPPGPASPQPLRCDFCYKSQHAVEWLIAGPKSYICDECVTVCGDLIREGHAAPPDPGSVAAPEPPDCVHCASERAQSRAMAEALSEYRRGIEAALKTLEDAAQTNGIPGYLKLRVWEMGQAVREGKAPMSAPDPQLSARLVLLERAAESCGIDTVRTYVKELAEMMRERGIV